MQSAVCGASSPPLPAARRRRASSLSGPACAHACARCSSRALLDGHRQHRPRWPPQAVLDPACAAARPRRERAAAHSGDIVRPSCASDSVREPVEPCHSLHPTAGSLRSGTCLLSTTARAACLLLSTRWPCQALPECITAMSVQCVWSALRSFTFIESVSRVIAQCRHNLIDRCWRTLCLPLERAFGNAC